LNWLGSYCLPCEKEEQHSKASEVSIESEKITEDQRVEYSVGMVNYINQEWGGSTGTMDHSAETEECASGENCEDDVIISKEMEVTGEGGGDGGEL
jgi:hypothetical protein